MGGGKYFAKLNPIVKEPKPQGAEPHVFGPLEPEPIEKKYQEQEPLREKVGSRSCMEKKSEPLKN